MNSYENVKKSSKSISDRQPSKSLQPMFFVKSCADMTRIRTESVAIVDNSQVTVRPLLLNLRLFEFMVKVGLHAK